MKKRLHGLCIAAGLLAVCLFSGCATPERSADANPYSGMSGGRYPGDPRGDGSGADSGKAAVEDLVSATLQNAPAAVH